MKIESVAVIAACALGLYLLYTGKQAAGALASVASDAYTGTVSTATGWMEIIFGRVAQPSGNVMQFSDVALRSQVRQELLAQGAPAWDALVGATNWVIGSPHPQYSFGRVVY